MSLSSSAKVNIGTSKGNIEIDLYAAQIPNLCKSFISNCINKKYIGCFFDKITSDLVQVHGSFDSSPIIKESHSRLKFDGKGDVGILNIDDSNKAIANGFFITTKPCPQFNSLYTIIGKISSESMYNVMKIVDGEKKEDGETLLFPVKITDILVPLPFFDDIIVEANVESPTTKPPTKKAKKTLQLDFKDDEEEEELLETPFKIKSAHEVKRKNSKNPEPRSTIDESSTGDKKKEKLSIVDADEVKLSDEQKTLESAEEMNEGQVEPMEQTEAKIEEKEQVKGEDDGKEGEDHVDGTEGEGEDEENECVSDKNSLPRKPDPSIDPYDKLLDISKDEVSFDKLQKHYFQCR